MTDQAEQITVKAFGVGCVYFGYSEDAELPGGGDACKEHLLELLGQVENLSNIQEQGKILYDSYTTIENNDRDIIVPMLYGSCISFDIFLPFRIQENISEVCDVELLHVDLVWGYEMPLMFVSYDWPDEEGDAAPSSGIVVVRKYLEKKLTKDGIVCSCVGPSPFHADFSVVPSKIDEGIDLVNVSGSDVGYSSIELRLPPGKSFAEAIENNTVQDFFSVYYHLAQLQNQAIRKHLVIINNAKILLNQENRRIWFGRVRDYFNHPKCIDVINREIIEETLIRMEMTEKMSQAIENRYIREGSGFDKFFSEFRVIINQDAWGKFSDVAKFFEERRQKTIGNLTAIISGLMGGMLGALIGSFSTYYLTKSDNGFRAVVHPVTSVVPAKLEHGAGKSK
jgi:hypothetical protein